MNFMNFLAVLLGVTLSIVVVGLILSLPVMLLWNYCLVPAVPIATEIGWLQAWGILVLSNFLFKATTK
jgi:hypothetical protein